MRGADCISDKEKEVPAEIQTELQQLRKITDGSALGKGGVVEACLRKQYSLKKQRCRQLWT